MSASDLAVVHNTQALHMSEAASTAVARARVDLSIDFWEFHALNPNVYRRFRQLCRHFYRMGVTKELGITSRMIFELMRLEQIVDEKVGPYVLNNNFVPYYSRLLYANDFETASAMLPLRTQRRAGIGGHTS
jgi:hypothetical protein